MITLQILLGLNSTQGGVTSNFLHANIREGENFYVVMPKYFEKYLKTGRKKCLKLKNTLYGLCQSPREFWQHLTKKLEACGLKKPEFNP